MLCITKSNLIILVFLFSSCFLGYSQINNQKIKNSLEIEKSNEISVKKSESFLSHVHRDVKKGNLPYYLDNLIIQNNTIPSFKIENSIVRELTPNELEEITDCKKYIPAEFEIVNYLGNSRNESLVYAKITSVRLNSLSN